MKLTEFFVQEVKEMVYYLNFYDNKRVTLLSGVILNENNCKMNNFIHSELSPAKNENKCSIF